MKKGIIFIALIALFLSWSSSVSAQCLPPNVNFVDCFRLSTDPARGTLGATTFIDILENIGGFLMIAAGVIAGIVLIVSGLMYMSAGSNSSRVTSAKAIFKNGVLGALIFFAAGLIINTVALLALDPLGFFS